MLGPAKGNSKSDLPTQMSNAMLGSIRSKSLQPGNRLHLLIFLIERQNFSRTSLHTTFNWLQELNLVRLFTNVAPCFNNLRRLFTINFQRQDQAVMRIQL